MSTKGLYEVIHSIETKHRQNINRAKKKSNEKDQEDGGSRLVRRRTSATEFNGTSSQYNMLSGLAKRTITSGSDS
jgi:hypothetical protein